MKAPVKVLVVDVGGTSPAVESHNLARGWVGFDVQAAFGCPVKMLNDAAMQALGSYRRGTMLFLGLGTGLGTALVVDASRRSSSDSSPRSSSPRSSSAEGTPRS